MASRKEYQMDFMLNAKLNGGFSSSVTKAQKEFAEIGTKIQNLNKLQSDISSYTKQQKAVENTSKKLENLQKQHDLLQKEIDQTEGSTEALEREKLKLEQRIDSTNNTLQTQQERLDSTGERLRENGVDTSNLTEETNRLNEEIEDLSHQQEEAGNQSASFGERFTDAMSNIGDAIEAIGLADFLHEVAQAYKECIDLAASLEATMSTVEAISGASGDEMVELTNKAKEMGATTKFTAVESAEAFTYMGMAGWKSGQMISGIEGIMNLAAASGEDLASTSDIVTDALTAFGLQAEDSAHFADIMAVASSNANTNVAMMGETFKYAAPVAGSLGYSAEDAAIAIGMMANSGIKASQAGTALRTGLTNLVKPTDTMQAAMDKYGISVTDAQGNMYSFRDLMDQLRLKLGGLGEAEQAAAAGAIFGKNAMSGWLAIINGSDADLQKLTGSVDNCAGAAERMAKVQLDNLNGDLTIMGSAFDGLKTTIGERFIPEGRKLVQISTEVLSLMDKFVQEHPVLFKAITGLIATITAATSAVLAFNAASKALAALKMAGMFTGLGGPIVAATVAIGALGGAIWALADDYFGAVPSVKELTTAVQEMDEGMQEARNTYEESAASYQATADMADIYLRKLDELGEGTEASENHSQKYLDTLGLLCNAIPELSDYIDLQTGAIEGGTEALKQHIEAWKEDAKQQAYQEYMDEVYSEYNNVMKEAAENNVKLIQAEAEREDILQKLTSAQERQTNMEEEARRTGESLGDGYNQVTREIKDYQKELDNCDREIDNLNEAIDIDNQKLAEQESVVEDAQAAVEELTAVHEEAAETTDELASAGDDLVSKIQEQVDSVSTLSEEYQKAYESALKSTEGQYGAFDNVQLKVESSTSDIISNLQSQAAYWDEYNTNISELRERANDIEGLNTAIDGMIDGSEESAQALQLLAGASDEDLQTYVDAWNEAHEGADLAAQNIASAQTGMEDDMDAFVREIQNDIDNLKLDSEASRAAKDTMQAYIDAINANGGANGPVARAARNVAQQAIDAFNSSISQMGSGVPSRWNSSKGYATGTTSAEPGLALVGEQGPELVAFKGGEQVLNAVQTANAVRSLDALSVPAGGGSTYTVNFAPSYNLNGSSNANEIRSILQQHDASLQSQLERILSNIDRDRGRTAFI